MRLAYKLAFNYVGSGSKWMTDLGCSLLHWPRNPYISGYDDNSINNDNNYF
jgi:hypothetical protein